MVVWAISHFQYHLYGHRVTVYTDHAAVKAVLDNISTSTSSTKQKQPKELSKKDKETTDEFILFNTPQKSQKETDNSRPTSLSQAFLREGDMYM